MSEETFAGNASKNDATLWMGDIEPYMDEKFIRESFAMAGEQVMNVKIIKSKIDGSPVGYGFVSFADSETSKRVLCQLNRKQMPNAPQGKRFKLNTVGRIDAQKTFTMFVGDLPEEIDDITLFTGFSVRYPSTKSANVILNNEGQSKGFGFVKFADECEYETALRECPQTVTFSAKPIRVSVAIPRNKIGQRPIQTIGTSNIVLTQPNDSTVDNYNRSLGDNCSQSSTQEQRYDAGYHYFDYSSYYQNYCGDYYQSMDNNAVGVSNAAAMGNFAFIRPRYFDYEASTNATISSFENFLTSIHDSKWF